MSKLATALALAFVSACAHVEELSDGSRRVTGFVRMTVPSAIPDDKRGADMLEVTTLGLSILSVPTASHVSFGYSSDRITVLRNNALVKIQEKGETP